MFSLSPDVATSPESLTSLIVAVGNSRPDSQPHFNTMEVRQRRTRRGLGVAGRVALEALRPTRRSDRLRIAGDGAAAEGIAWFLCSTRTLLCGRSWPPRRGQPKLSRAESVH